MTIVPYNKTGQATHMDGAAASRSAELMLRDAATQFDGGAASTVPSRTSKGGRDHDLSKLNRLALIAFSILALVVAGIAAVPLSDAVQHVALTIMRPRTH